MFKPLKNILRNQRGLGFTMVLIMTAVAAALSVPLLEFTSSVLHRTSNINSTLDAQYTLDAATEDAMWRLAYDQPFLAALAISSPQSYTVTLNGQTVTNTVGPFLQNPPPPTPALPPACGQGNCIVWWTEINPSLINLTQRADGDGDGDKEVEARLTIYIRNGGTSNASIRSIRELLPPGFKYDGNRQSINLVDNQGAPIAVGNPSVLGPPWSNTGPDIINACNPRSSIQAGNQQRLEWDWSGGAAPRVQPGATAQISFDIELDDIVSPGIYTDMPWVDTVPNACASGLNAGRPSSLTIFYTAIVKSQGANNSITSRVEIKPDEHKINAQRYGN